MAYREEGAELAAFKHHLEIAETLLGVNADLSEQLASNADGEMCRPHPTTVDDRRTSR